MRIWLITTIVCVWMLSGCGGGGNPLDDFLRDPDGEPIRNAVRTAVPVAHIASISMATVRGNAPSNATASHTCSSYPCTALVYIDALSRFSLEPMCDMAEHKQETIIEARVKWNMLISVIPACRYPESASE